MSKMKTCEEIIHNQVVAARAQGLGLLYRVVVDQDIRRNVGIDNLYPDIIVLDKNNSVLFIEEVETESPLTDDMRDEKWTEHIGTGNPFNLIVPESQILRARYLIMGLDINKLYYYKPTPLGIRFRLVLI